MKWIGALSLMTAVFLQACGGGGGGGASVGLLSAPQQRPFPGSGINAGMVVSKGSIAANGVRFNAGAAPTFRFGFGDLPGGGEAAVRVGMIVRMRGAFGAIDTQGSYSSPGAGIPAVEVEPQAIGAVENLAGNTFDVLGQAVTVTPFTIFDAPANRVLVNGEIVEVHGFFTGPNAIEATFIQRTPGATGRQVRGVVTLLNNAAGTLSIGSQQVTFPLPAPAGLAEGRFVEVEGTLAGAILTAAKVEVQDLATEADNEIEIEGTVVSHNAGTKTFVLRTPSGLLNGSYDPPPPVLPAGQVTRFELEERNTLSNAATVLAAGNQVEAEGRLVGGALQAREIEMRRSENVVLEGDVATGGGGTFTVGPFPFLLTPPPGVAVSNGAHVEVGANVVPGTTAITVTRVTVLPATTRLLLQGPITAHGDGITGNTITILGIPVDTTGLQEQDDPILGIPSEYTNVVNERITKAQFFPLLENLVTVVKAKAQNDPLDPPFAAGIYHPRSGVDIETHR